MASTVLPNGIIVPEKFSRDWYADLYHNWQELDNLLGGGTPKDGTLTIQKNGDTVGTFSANQATDETVNIEVPTATSELTNDSGFITGVSWDDVSDKPSFATVATSGSYNDLSNKPTIPTVNDATLTIQKNGTTINTFTANSSTDKTVNIQCVDLTNNQTVGGIKTFSSKITGTIDKSKDYYLNGNTLASENGSLGTVKYYPSTSTADLDTEIFEHSLWAASKAVNSIPTTLDVFYYIDQYFYGGRTSTSNRIQILRGYRNANLHMVRVYDNSTNSWSAWAKFADESDVVPRSGGAVMTGTSLSRTVDNSELRFEAGSDWNKGGAILVFGKDHSTVPGQVQLRPSNGTNAASMFLYPDGTWTWNGTACQITSDQRLKQQISEIDDKLLDAWEDVELSQFKYNDAVDEKGDNARLHTGYVVQQIDNACKSHGVDISSYGLYCHEEYPQETEEVEVEQADGTKTKERKVIREASEHYSLRYTEVYAVECMYLRRCIARLTARIEELEKGNNTK